MKSAIEESRDISFIWLCNLWKLYTAREMKDFLYGFHQLTASSDSIMLAEVSFLMLICEVKKNEENQ